MMDTNLRLHKFNVQEMVPYSHSELLCFELSPSAFAALPDIFMTTLCRTWGPQPSRIYLTCTLCKSCCQAQLILTPQVRSALIDVYNGYFTIHQMCVSEYCVEPV